MIYDTHELETETVGSSALRRRIGRLLEWSFVRFCTAVVVVNESIGEWYRAHHPSARVVVVRNVPYRTSHPVERTDAFRSLLSIPDADLVFLYQGSIHRGRAAEMLLDVFVDMPTDRHMVFMGYGDLEPTIRAASTQRSNIHFVAAVPPGEVLAMTASADVGICLIENVCVSYHLSLPNKLMEYTSAGIPTIASAFPEMSRFITDTGAGWTVEVEPGAVAALIRSLDADAIAAAAARAREARSRLSWEDESVPLVDLYRSIGSRLGR